MSKSMYYLKSNEELKAYDIFKRQGMMAEDGQLSDYKVATIYDPEHIDLFLNVLDMEDQRQESDFVEEIEPDESDEHEDAVG